MTPTTTTFFALQRLESVTDLTMSFRLRYESVTLGILSPMDTDKVGLFGLVIIRVRGWTVEMGGGPGGP